MGRPSNTDTRREQIVDGLVRVMARRGYEQATIPEIAREAGLAAGLVHYHFDNKLEILLALVDRLTGFARARIESRLGAAGDDPRRRLDAFFDALLALGDDADPAAAVCWAFVGADAIRLPEVRTLYQRWLEEARDALRELFAAVLAAEDRERAGLDAMAAGMVAAIEGFFALGAAAPKVVPAGSAAGVAKRMAEGLVGAQPMRASRRRRRAHGARA